MGSDFNLWSINDVLREATRAVHNIDLMKNEDSFLSLQKCMKASVLIEEDIDYLLCYDEVVLNLCTVGCDIEQGFGAKSRFLLATLF